MRLSRREFFTHKRPHTQTLCRNGPEAPTSQSREAGNVGPATRNSHGYSTQRASRVFLLFTFSSSPFPLLFFLFSFSTSLFPLLFFLFSFSSPLLFFLFSFPLLFFLFSLYFSFSSLFFLLFSPSSLFPLLFFLFSFSSSLFPLLFFLLGFFPLEFFSSSLCIFPFPLSCSSSFPPLLFFLSSFSSFLFPLLFFLFSFSSFSPLLLYSTTLCSTTPLQSARPFYSTLIYPALLFSALLSSCLFFHTLLVLLLTFLAKVTLTPQLQWPCISKPFLRQAEVARNRRATEPTVPQAPALVYLKKHHAMYTTSNSQERFLVARRQRETIEIVFAPCRGVMLSNVRLRHVWLRRCEVESCEIEKM